MPLKHPKEKEPGPEFVDYEDAGKSGERGIYEGLETAPTAGSTLNPVRPQSKQEHKDSQTPTKTQVKFKFKFV